MIMAVTMVVLSRLQQRLTPSSFVLLLPFTLHTSHPPWRSLASGAAPPSPDAPRGRGRRRGRPHAAVAAAGSRRPPSPPGPPTGPEAGPAWSGVGCSWCVGVVKGGGVDLISSSSQSDPCLPACLPTLPTTHTHQRRRRGVQRRRPLLPLQPLPELPHPHAEPQGALALLLRRLGRRLPSCVCM